MKKPVICLCMTALLLGFTACVATGDSEGSQENSVTERNEGVASNQKDTELFSGDKEVEQKDTNSIRQTLVEVLGEDYWPDMQIDPEYLEEYGLYSDIYDVFYGEMLKDTTNADTLIIIGAKEGMVEEAEEVLNRYREALVADIDQYPMNAGKIQASRIETIGNYVCFVQLGADTRNEYGENGNEDAVIRHCQEQNELAIEAISKKLGG
ncbi:MAG: DUF4358 domain-containing protein [Lachnospiraceae bacterium]|nr:DUF4358 domain-containing protein [Lachnospiraceae bacterium]